MGTCEWCLMNEKMQKYHDEEWGVPVYDDIKQFEFLMMEVMQCGLNWNMMIQKREIFRECFDNFDFRKIAEYDSSDIERIMGVEGMIRSIRKINAVISNARRFIEVINEFGSFFNYLAAFAGDKAICYAGHEKGAIPARNSLSDNISADLKRRGFKFLGSITVYSHLSACGVINDHVENCFRYKYIRENYPVIEIAEV